MRFIAAMLQFIGLVSIVHGVVLMAQATEHTWIFKVTYHNTRNAADTVDFFELRNADQAPMLTVDSNSDIAQFLRSNDGKRIVLTLDTSELKEIKR